MVRVETACETRVARTQPIHIAVTAWGRWGLRRVKQYRVSWNEVIAPRRRTCFMGDHGHAVPRLQHVPETMASRGCSVPRLSTSRGHVASSPGSQLCLAVGRNVTSMEMHWRSRASWTSANPRSWSILLVSRCGRVWFIPVPRSTGHNAATQHERCALCLHTHEPRVSWSKPNAKTCFNFPNSLSTRGACYQQQQEGSSFRRGAPVRSQSGWCGTQACSTTRPTPPFPRP